MRVVFIGAGHVATHLALAVHAAGLQVVQVFSHTANRAQVLAEKLQATFTTEAAEVVGDADLYFFCWKDDLLREVVVQIKPNQGLWVHTAGSVSMGVFEGHALRYGVLYPLQTFSKERPVNFRQIPCFVEAATPHDAHLLLETAALLSDRAQVLPTEKRKYLHLAAVFACNFTNHLYALAGKILNEQQLPADVLLPLIDETAAKIHDLPALRAQTGPAMRQDKGVMGSHLQLLVDPQQQEIYRLISDSIYKQTFS